MTFEGIWICIILHIKVLWINFSFFWISCMKCYCLFRVYGTLLISLGWFHFCCLFWYISHSLVSIMCFIHHVCFFILRERFFFSICWNNSELAPLIVPDLVSYRNVARRIYSRAEVSGTNHLNKWIASYGPYRSYGYASCTWLSPCLGSLLWQVYPLAIKRILKRPPTFTSNTQRDPIILDLLLFILFGRGTNSQQLCFLIDANSSSIAHSYCCASGLLIASA